MLVVVLWRRIGDNFRADTGPPLRLPGKAHVSNTYWWTRKVLAENEVDLDDDHDLDDGKSRI